MLNENVMAIHLTVELIKKRQYKQVNIFLNQELCGEMRKLY